MSRHTTPSPTPKGLVPISSLWSAQTSPVEDYTDELYTMSEKEARQRSDMIDRMLKGEGAARAAARRKQRKLLFLGQSESGKSTLVKQFRLMQSSETFVSERESWRSIVFLNIIRSILRIVDIVSPNFNLKNPSDSRSQEFARLRLRLTPLRSVESSIVEFLSSPREVARSRSQHSRSSRTNGASSLNNGNRNSSEFDGDYHDVYVHPESPWQRILHTCMRNANAVRTSTSDSDGESVHATTDDPAATLQACAGDMKLLWTSSFVQDCLKQSGLFIEEISGFFLNDIDRIASTDYVPTDDDVLRARVKTIWPTEIILPKFEPGLEWRLYDVGGARRQRAKWAPFFDDRAVAYPVDLIIVLVPVSAFDQTLAEDKTVNRLQDSFEMWTELCKTTALHHIPILLFLNKCDLLEKKLNAGKQLADYLITYEGKPNESKKILQYLSKRFAGMRKESQAPSSTPCYIHHTSVVDRTTTQTVIAHVRDQIVMGHMRESYFV
ncbi:Guanine nucleotide-binding protein alpha-4 subunit [Ceratobasidium theobromae]|uniref:Guanine nucleotide-binding protein alpha-4 subunit n=1 Tax=Ceratobasidium theobromae TaxID=1582974 RepID=A0A5N5QWS1_9AGAM|nr:Guanine nucleotide-binding protein alpha-4 subunit [Ceratobasidium theobromae]